MSSANYMSVTNYVMPVTNYMMSVTKLRDVKYKLHGVSGISHHDNIKIHDALSAGNNM